MERNNQITLEKPEGKTERHYRRKIGKTTYLVTALFNDKAAETVVDKIEKMLVNDTRI